MSILAEFSIVPLGKGTSVSPLIARAMKIVVESGLAYRVNPMGTVLEGEWGEVMETIRKCQNDLMQDADRVVTTIRIDERRDGGSRMEKKLESVEQKLGMKLNR